MRLLTKLLLLVVPTGLVHAQAPAYPTEVRVRVVLERVRDSSSVDTEQVERALSAALMADGLRVLPNTDATRPQLQYRILVTPVTSEGNEVGHQFRVDLLLVEQAQLDRAPGHSYSVTTYSTGSLGSGGRHQDLTPMLASTAERLAKKYADKTHKP